MTALAGIICSDGIVMAGDTQFTAGDGTVGYGDKIAVVHFNNAEHVLVGQAGLPSITHHLVEIMRENAKGVTVRNPKDVTDIAEEAIREMRLKTSDDHWNWGRDYGSAGLLLAFYSHRVPLMCSINVYQTGKAEYSKTHYLGGGVGRPLVEYIISEFSQAGTSVREAIPTAIFAIKKAKEYQPGACGGNTTVRVMEKMSVSNFEKPIIGHSLALNQDVVNRAEARLGEMDKDLKRQLNAKAVPMIEEVASDVWRKHLQNVEAEQRSEEEEEARLANPQISSPGSSN